MIKKPAQLFINTQEAVKFGETASIEDMSHLIEKLTTIIIQNIADISVELQLYNEALHAFKKDHWYQAYKNKCLK